MQFTNTAEDDEEIGDDFENLYKGEISKSGTPILPSKRARKTPEKITADVDNSVGEETMNEQGEVSLDEVSESENQEADVSSEIKKQTYLQTTLKLQTLKKII